MHQALNPMGAPSPSPLSHLEFLPQEPAELISNEKMQASLSCCWAEVLGFVTGVGMIVQEICRRNGYGRMFYKGFSPHVPVLVITGVYGGIGTCGKHRDRYGYP